MRPFVLAVLLLTGGSFAAFAWPVHPFIRHKVDSLNRDLAGQVLDFTHNHGADRRIWSSALCAKRDLYVYLPPCFDPSKQYPGMLYLHGIAQDEASFLRIVGHFDRAMRCGQLPPMVIAAPDGTTAGDPTVFNAGSFYVNSRAGRFEDYVMQDAWPFVKANFSVRPEPECHVIGGASMGGFGAYNLAIKYRCEFKTVAGIFPPLHTRYVNCRGRSFANFDPCCLGMRDRANPLRPVARFAGGAITIRERAITKPLYGSLGQHVVEQIAAENPYEMLDNYNVQPGELNMFVGYGSKDQFNIDAQAEAFVHRARCRGLAVTSVCVPGGRHDEATGIRLFPDFAAWVTPIVAPCAP